MDSAAPTATVTGNKKQTKGRQKIEMKKIVNEDDRLITFSKRRSGIYKKASELATLCGAEVGVVVFSPAGKPFSFAHPCIETIANKFLNDNNNKNKNNKGNNDDNNNDDEISSNNNNNNNNAAHPLVEAHRRVRINELNQQHNQLLSQLDAEKEKGKALEKLKKVRGNGRGWWETPTEELGIEELQEVDASLGEIYTNVCHQLKQRGVIGCCSYNNYNNNINNPSMGFTTNDPLGEETIPFNILAGNVPPPLFPPLPPPPYLPPPPHFDYGEQQHHHPHHPHP